MKTLLIAIALTLLSGCTVYKVHSVAPDGKEIKVSVYSGRQFEQPDLIYKREGNDAEFGFKAAKTTDSNAVILQALLSGALAIPPQ
jgi:hypothetical protein